MTIENGTRSRVVNVMIRQQNPKFIANGRCISSMRLQALLCDRFAG